MIPLDGCALDRWSEPVRRTAGWAAEASWQASVVVALVLLAQWALRRQISARWRYGLWALVLARLLLPVLPESRYSPFNWAANLRDRWRPAVPAAPTPTPVMTVAVRRDGPAFKPSPPVLPNRSTVPTVPTLPREGITYMRWAAPPARAVASAPVEGGTAGFTWAAMTGWITAVSPSAPRNAGVVAIDLATNTGAEAALPHEAEAILPPTVVSQNAAVAPAWPAVSTAQPALCWTCLAAWLWLAGAFALGSRIAWTSGRLARRVRRMPLVRDRQVLDLFNRCRRDVGVRRAPQLRLAPDGFGPALVGVFRPCVLLPRCVVRQFDLPELRMVLLHELTHLRRRDVPVNWLLSILHVLHWFNPVLWLAFARMRADRELACDEAVLRAAGPGAGRAYGPAIVKLIEIVSLPRGHGGAGPAPPLVAGMGLGMVGVLDGKASLRRRIAMIARFDPTDPKLGRWSVPGLALSLVIGGVALTGRVRGQEPAAAPPAAETRAPSAGADQSENPGRAPASAAPAAETAPLTPAPGVEPVAASAAPPASSSSAEAPVAPAPWAEAAPSAGLPPPTPAGTAPAPSAAAPAGPSRGLAHALTTPPPAVAPATGLPSPVTVGPVAPLRRGSRKIGADQQIEIAFVGEDGKVYSTHLVQVNAQGNIDLPYADGIHARGLSEDQLHGAILKAYSGSKQMPAPNIAVRVLGRPGAAANEAQPAPQPTPALPSLTPAAPAPALAPPGGLAPPSVTPVPPMMPTPVPTSVAPANTTPPQPAMVAPGAAGGAVPRGLGQPPAGDDRIRPGDLVSVAVLELNGPETATVVTKRVDREGNVHLPYVGAVPAAGKTPAELENASKKSYEEHNLIRNAVVIVTRPDRGESFRLESRRMQSAPAPAGDVPTGPRGDAGYGGFGGFPGAAGGGARVGAFNPAAGPGPGGAGVPPPTENAQPAGNLSFAGRVQSAAAQAADEQTAAKLQRPLPEVKFDGVPLKDALDFYHDVAQVDFFFDAKALEAAGVDANTPVTVNLRNVPAEQALALMLRSTSPNVGYTIDGGVVYVSAADEVARKVITRVYPVGNLANPGGATLEQLIRDTVAPESWRDSGGSTGVILRYGGKLVVTTTEPNHREVKKLLDLLQSEAKGNGGDHEAPATDGAKK